MFIRSKDKKDEAREEKLWKELLRGKSRSSEQAGKAVAYCKDFIKEYDEWFEYNESRWLRLQRVIIIGGVVATLYGTIPDELLKSIPWGGFLGWSRGVPPGIVTIAAGLLSSFTYKEDAVRHEVTANTLRNELIKFLCDAAPYNKSDESKDTSIFLNTICRIIDGELQGWRELVTETRSQNVSRTT
jgi:hypothetical protein